MFDGYELRLKIFYSKMHPGSFTNTYIDITDFVNPEIVKNTKT